MAKLTILQNGKEIKTLTLAEDQEYIGGRAKDVDIPLDGNQKISRQHFRLFFDGTNWQAEVLSKYGELLFEGKETQNAHLIGDCKFSIPPYDFLMEETEAASMLPAEYEEPDASSSDYLPAASLDSDSYDEDEVTFGGQVEGLPFIRIVDKDNKNLQTLRLEGNFWSAGRDASAAIQIRDMRVSRNQFQILGTPEGYFIKDLGSVNGTLLNGTPLKPNDPHPIRSGDVISVLDQYLYFEIRDPEFSNKVMQIDPRVAQPVMMNPQIYQQPQPGQLPQQHTSSMIMPQEEQGPYQLSIADFKDGSWKVKIKDLDKQSKIRVALVAVIVLVFGIALMPQEGPAPKVDNAIVDPFTKLSPEDQEFVKRTYVLAKNLYMQGKYELASSEIAKIHEKIEEGYEDSVQIKDYAAEAIKIREEKERIRKEQEERRQLEEEAQSIIAGCKNLLADENSIDVEEITQCLSPAMDRVGITAEDHPLAAEIQDMIERASAIIEDRKRREAEQADFQRRAKKGRGLYYAAEKLRKEGKPHKAIAQYKRHIASSLPDPDGLKKVSKRRISAIRDVVQSEADKFIKKSEEFYEQQDLRASVLEIDKALRLKKIDKELSRKRKQIVNELRKRMQILYQESILEESLGNIESAKDRWYKIIELDVPKGEYAKKATIKIKKYGGL